MKFRSAPNLWFRYLIASISPRWSVRLLYRICHHKQLNLDNPQTMDEKIQWLKLHYCQQDIVKQCADKYRVREYVKACGLAHILNPLIDKYHSASEIPWNLLPDKFVLKWNFGCGGNVICPDKSKLDIYAATRELNKFGKIKFHLIAAEPQYDIPEKLILCEEFIETEDGHAPVEQRCLHQP